jgi:hypothetical protein
MAIEGSHTKWIVQRYGEEQEVLSFQHSALNSD